MSLISNLSIKHKITLVIMAAAGLPLLLTYAFIFTFELTRFQQNYERDLTSLAQMFAANSTGAVAFKDKKVAQEILSSLKAKPQVDHAWLLLKDGTVFAEYGEHQTPSKWLARLKKGHPREKRVLQMCPIVLDGEELGMLLLKSDYQAKGLELLFLYGGIGILMLCGSLLLTLFMSSRLQGFISKPILQLADTARIVSLKKDYSVRAESAGTDELGLLTSAFNQMLAQIQARDSALQVEIAERSRTEAALQESRQRYEAAVLGSSDGLWDWTLASNQVYFSPRWKSILGYEDHEVANQHEEFVQRIHDNDRSRVLELIEECLSSPNKQFEVEFRMRCKDGSYRWILSRGAVLRDLTGKSFRMSGSHTDISTRKQAEQEMKDLHAQLLQSSRHAGMAEVATGVLHNVGNVLNSINVSSSLVMEWARESKVPMLVKISDLLQQHQSDLADFLTKDPQGRHLPEILSKLAAHLSSENSQFADELELLGKNISHIKNIVAMQQDYARISGLTEQLSLVDLIEHALQLNTASFARQNIRVLREFEPVPPVMVDKHRVLQILVNLLRNAGHAMNAPSVTERALTVGLRSKGTNAVQITVKDNGIGIGNENLTRIFSHGFTTRHDGHGFGLHSGALAAKDMGGSLSVHSDGPGKGAVFTLELPFHRSEKAS